MLSASGGLGATVAGSIPRQQQPTSLNSNVNSIGENRVGRADEAASKVYRSAQLTEPLATEEKNGFLTWFCGCPRFFCCARESDGDFAKTTVAFVHDDCNGLGGEEADSIGSASDVNVGDRNVDKPNRWFDNDSLFVFDSITPERRSGPSVL